MDFVLFCELTARYYCFLLVKALCQLLTSGRKRPRLRLLPPLALASLCVRWCIANPKRSPWLAGSPGGRNM